MKESIFRDFGKGFLDLFFPELCPNCQIELKEKETGICLPCLAGLPKTDFHRYSLNPVFKLLMGRIPNLGCSSAGFYFRKGNSIQKIMHSIKYKSNAKAAIVLGEFYANFLFENESFGDIDCIIPVPLHSDRFEKRGFNQSEAFAKGLAKVIAKPILTDCLVRIKSSDSQSHKSKEKRLELLSRDFEIRQADTLKDKKILLVDDIITTGTTLEACGKLLAESSLKPIKISAIAYTLV